MNVTPTSLAQEYCPFGQDHLEDPYRFYTRARQHPIFATNTLLEDGTPVYVVTRFEDAHEILAHPERFSSRDTLRPVSALHEETLAILAEGYAPTPIHLNTDGEAHRRFRKPLARAFSSARIAPFKARMYAHAHRLLDASAQAACLDVITEFACPLTLDIILELFHLPAGDRAQAKVWCDYWLKLVSARLTPDEQAEAARGVVAFQHYLAHLIQQRTREPLPDDLISDLVRPDSAQPPFLLEELINVLGGLLLAGHETSTNMIGNAVVSLLTHREHWNAICKQPEAIPAYVEELLRLDTPAQTFFRTSLQETRIGDVTIPANALLLLVFGSVNRDERVFSDADQFVPGRAEKHLVFGWGPHVCLGASLARLEGTIALEVLSQRYPDLRLVLHQSLYHSKNLMFRGFEHILVQYQQEEEPVCKQ